MNLIPEDRADSVEMTGVMYSEGIRIWSSADARPSGAVPLRRDADRASSSIAALSPDGACVVGAECVGADQGHDKLVCWTPNPNAAHTSGQIYAPNQPCAVELVEDIGSSSAADPSSPIGSPPVDKDGKDLGGEQVTCIAFSPCGTMLLTACVVDNGYDTEHIIQSCAKLWTKSAASGAWEHRRNFATAALGQPMEGHHTVPGSEVEDQPSKINAVAFSANGARVVTAGDDGCAILWDVKLLLTDGFRETNETTTHLHYGHPKFSGEGVDNNTLFNAKHRGHISRENSKGITKSVSVIMRETEIMVAEKERAAKQTPLERAATPIVVGHSWPITSVAFSCDSLGQLLTGGMDGRAVLWDVPSDLLINEVRSCYVINPDDREQVLYSHRWGQREPMRDRAINDVAFLEGHRRGLGSNRHGFDTGSRWATGGVDGTIVVWDAATHEIVARLERGHGGLGAAAKIHAVAFARDGATLISGGSDGFACLWDLTTQIVVARLRHASCSESTKKSVTSVAIRDVDQGRVMMTAGVDGSVRVYEHPSHQEVRPIGTDLARTRAELISLSPDGRWIITAHNDPNPSVDIWDTHPLHLRRGANAGGASAQAKAHHGVRVASLKGLQHERHIKHFSFVGIDTDHSTPGVNLPWFWGALAWNHNGDRILTLGGELGATEAEQTCAIWKSPPEEMIRRANHARKKHRAISCGAAGPGDWKVRNSLSKPDALLADRWDYVELGLRSPGGHDNEAMTVRCACWTPDGERVVTGEDAVLAGGDTDGSTPGWVGGRAVVWNVAKLEAGEVGIVCVLPHVDHANIPRGIACLRAAVLNSGRRLCVTGGDAGSCVVWDLDLAVALTAEEKPPVPHGELYNAHRGHAEATITAVRFDPLGCGQTHTIRILTAGSLKACMWSYDMTGDFDGIDATGPVAHLTGDFEGGHKGKTLTAADFSPAGDRVITAAEDGNVCVWDAAPFTSDTIFSLSAGVAGGIRQHAQIARLNCEQQRHLQAEFSPDAQYVITGASENEGGSVALMWPLLWSHHELRSNPHIEIENWSYLENDLGFGPSNAVDSSLHSFAMRWHTAEDDPESLDSGGPFFALLAWATTCMRTAVEEDEEDRKRRRHVEERLNAKMRLYSTQFKYWARSESTRYLPISTATDGKGETPLSSAAKHHNHDFISTVFDSKNVVEPPGGEQRSNSTRIMSALRTSDLTELLSVQPQRVLSVLNDKALVRAVPDWCEHLTVGAETHVFSAGRTFEVAGGKRGIAEHPGFWARQLNERYDSNLSVYERVCRVNRCFNGRRAVSLLVPGGAPKKYDTRPPEQTQAFLVALDDIAGDAGEALIARLYDLDSVTLEAFQTDVVKALAVFKWRVFGEGFYFLRVAYFIVYLAVHTYVTVASRRFDKSFYTIEDHLSYNKPWIIAPTLYIIACTIFDLISELVRMPQAGVMRWFSSLRGPMGLVRIGATLFTFIPILLIAFGFPCFEDQNAVPAPFNGTIPMGMDVYVEVRVKCVNGYPPLLTFKHGWGRAYTAIGNFAKGTGRINGEIEKLPASGFLPNNAGQFSWFGLLAIANMLTWGMAPHMTRGLPGLGWFMYLVGESLRDMRPFLIYLLGVIIAFSTGMYVISVGSYECGIEPDLYPQCDSNGDSFGALGQGWFGAFLQLCGWLFGDWDVDQIMQSHNQPVSFIFFFAFVLLISITCFNLLISILSDTFDKAKDTKERVRHREFLAIAQECVALLELYMCVNPCTRGTAGPRWCHASHRTEDGAMRPCHVLRSALCFLPRLYIDTLEPYINPPYLHILRPRRYGTTHGNEGSDDSGNRATGRLHTLQRTIREQNAMVSRRTDQRVDDLQAQVSAMRTEMRESLDDMKSSMDSMVKALHLVKRKSGTATRGGGGLVVERKTSQLVGEVDATFIKRKEVVREAREKRAAQMKRRHAKKQAIMKKMKEGGAASKKPPQPPPPSK